MLIRETELAVMQIELVDLARLNDSVDRVVDFLNGLEKKYEGRYTDLRFTFSTQGGQMVTHVSGIPVSDLSGSKDA